MANEGASWSAAGGSDRLWPSGCTRAGWEVVVVDETEEALERLGREVARRVPPSGTAWTPRCSRRPGSPTADASSSRPTATTRTSSSRRSRSSATTCPKSLRASSTRRGPTFYADRGFDVVSPTKIAIEALAALASATVRRRECSSSSSAAARSATNVTRTLLELGHEVVLVEQDGGGRYERLDEEFGHRATLRRRDRDLRARAGRDRAAARHRRRGDRRRRGQHRHLPARQGELRRLEGRRAGERPAQPAALRSPRDLPRRSPRRRWCWRWSSTRSREHELVHLARAPRENLEIVEVEVGEAAVGGGQAGRPAPPAARPRASSRSCGTGRPRSPSARPSSARATRCSPSSSRAASPSSGGCWSARRSQGLTGAAAGLERAQPRPCCAAARRP